MPTISGTSGLVAGFDTKAAVDEMLGLRKFEISQLNNKKEAEIVKQNSFSELNSLLRDFKSQSASMRDVDTFFTYTASLNSSNANVPATSLIDVAGDDTVTAGNHSIVVDQVAAAARFSSSSAVLDSTGNAITSETASLNLASGSFQINGTTINVDAADSLKDIANAINTASTGVTATVIKVADADFRLVLASDETGSTGFSLTGTDLDAAGPLASLQFGATGQSNAAKELQAAKDAIVTIDGLTITRSSNTIGDAISGLTFTIKQADPATTVSMNIGIDTINVRDKIQAFVDSYNAVYSFINEQFKVNPETGESGTLSGEPLLTSIQSSLTSSLLQNVPGLASDRNSLVKIGIEPDEYGTLSINDNLFTNFLNNDTKAIRDVFVAKGSSSTPGMQFLVAGDKTLSGNYDINLSQTASRASTTGTIDVFNTPLTANYTINVTEYGNERLANILLTSGDTQNDIIAKLNSEFTRTITETRVFDQILTDSSTSLAATGSTTFANLGGVAGETITITGITRTGQSVNSSFTIIDPVQDTISDLLSAIQTAYNQQVTASIDATGRIQVEDNSSGDSLLAVNLSSTGSINFGVDTTSYSTEGRFAMSLEAIATDTFVTIQHKNFGANKGFNISGADLALGITDTGGSALLGTDIAGTINGEATRGNGQVLVGTAGSAEGIGILYSGNNTAPFSSTMTIGMGIAASFDGVLDLFSNPFSGLIQNNIIASEVTNSSLDSKIASLELQMEKQRISLTRSFMLMEQSMSAMNASGNYLSQQIDAMNSSRRN